MASPGPAGAASAAASPSPPMQLPSPFAELVKAPSGLEKIVLRGARNCCAEVHDFGLAHPPPPMPLVVCPVVHTTRLQCAGARVRGAAIRFYFGAVGADPVGILLIRGGFGRNS